MHLASIGIFEGGPLLSEGGALRLTELPTARLVPPAVRAPAPAESTCRAVAPGATDVGGRQVIRHPLPRSRMPAPGSGNEAQLLQLCGDLLAQPLDRSRPLWELVFVTGLADDRIAIVEKLHHSMADGISTAELATVLLDLSPDASVLPEFQWEPAQVPTADERTFHDLSRLAGVAFRVRPGSDGRSPTPSAGPARRNDLARRWRRCCPPASSPGHPRSTARSGASERST